MSRVELLSLGFLLVTSTACGPGRLSAEGEEGTGETVVATTDEDEGEIGGWEFEGEVDDDDWGEDVEDEGEVDVEGDGDGEDESESGDPDGAPNGATCFADDECASLDCYTVPFLGGWCGECNEDADCPDGGCTAPNVWVFEGSSCNVGELGGGCETDVVCMPGLSCSTALDLLEVVQLNTCGQCLDHGDCFGGQICAPQVDVQSWSGARVCMLPGALMQDAFCELDGTGELACASGICSAADIMGIAEIGACGECKTDADCPVGDCVPATFDLDVGKLTGSRCLAP